MLVLCNSYVLINYIVIEHEHESYVKLDSFAIGNLCESHYITHPSYENRKKIELI